MVKVVTGVNELARNHRYYILLKNVFSAENIYQESLARGGEKLLITLVFYELFLAHCFNMRAQCDENLVRNMYKIAPTVDISLLNKVEQIIANEMLEFTSLESVIEKVTNKLHLLSKSRIRLERNVLSVSTKFSQKNVEELIFNYYAFLNEAAFTYPYRGGCF